MPIISSPSAPAANAPVWAGAALANSFDKLKSTYNWKASNTQKLRRSLGAAARGGRADWVFVGDSATAGAVSTVGTNVFDRYNAWPYGMRNALVGMGVPVGGTGLARVVDSASFADTQRYSTTGVWTNNASSMSTTAVSASCTFTPDVGGTLLDVWYFAFTGGGTFTVAVAGATSGAGFTTVNTGATNVGWTKVRLSGLNILANQTKIVLTVTVAGSGVYIKGMGTSTPNGGLVCHNLAQSGSTAGPAATAGTWVDTSTQGIGVVMRDAPGITRTVTDAVFNGTTTMTSATAAFTANDVGEPVDFPNGPPAAGIVLPENVYIVSVTNATTVVLSSAAYVSVSAQTVRIGRTPSVVVIELGFNDLTNGRAANAITADIQTIRNWWPSADCILTVAQEGAYTINSQAVQDALAAAIYQLADILDVPLFDWRDRLGRYATALANGVYGDTVHIVPSVQAMIGAQMAEIVGESAGNSQTFTLPTNNYDLTPKKYVDDRTKSSTVANLATVTTTTETVVMSMPIPANSLKVGSAYDYQLSMKPAIAAGTTVRVRIGTAGTIADAAVVTMSVTVAQTSALARYAEGVGAITAIGASAAHSGVGSEAIHAIAAAVGSAGAITTAGTFDSTKDNILTVTVQNNTSTTTTVQAGRLELTY